MSKPDADPSKQHSGVFLKSATYQRNRHRKSIYKVVDDLRMEKYRRFPLIWLEERLGEQRTDYEWSKIDEALYKKHKWDGDEDPLANAWQELAKGNWVAIEAATGTSKTFFAARVALWYLDVYEDSLVITSAPKEDQLKLHLWAEITKIAYKFKKIRPKSKMMKLRLKVDNSVEEEEFNEMEQDKSESWQAIGFVAGAGSEEESATKAQGFHRERMLIIIEETPGMRAAVMTAFQNTSTGDNNLILAMGNPDNEFDELHRFGERKRVKDFRISAYDYPNVVLKRAAFPGAVGIDSIEDRRDTYGEKSPMFLSRIRGISPAQSENSLIKVDWITQCIGINPINTEDSYNAVGVDVANSEDGDKAAVAYGEGPSLQFVKEFQCPNATDLAYNLMYNDWEMQEQEERMLGKTIERYGIEPVDDWEIAPECIGVDAVGVGVATVNALQEVGYNCTAIQGGPWKEVIPEDDNVDPPKPLYEFMSLRVQMWWELREDLRHRRISIDLPEEPESEAMLRQITRELTTPQWVQRGNKITIEKKEEIKKRLHGKSPNVGDCIVYWNWMRKGYRMMGGEMPLKGGV